MMTNDILLFCCFCKKRHFLCVKAIYQINIIYKIIIVKKLFLVCAVQIHSHLRDHVIALMMTSSENRIYPIFFKDVFFEKRLEK